MHNHETLDLLAKILGWDSETRHRLTNLFRFSIFEEVVKIVKKLNYKRLWILKYIDYNSETF